MSEQKNHFTHESLSLNQAHSYSLLLQINAESFNYAIASGKQLLAWAENYSLDELKDPKILRDTLTANYKQVIVGLASTGFTLLPKGLFDKDHLVDVARMLDVHDNEKVHFQSVNSDNVIIYKVDQELTANMNDFDAPVINYKAKGWIKAIANNFPLDKNLYVNVADETVEFVNFHNQSLRFYNHFNFKNHEELAYYCAFVAQDLKLDPQEVTIIISGEISYGDRCFTFLADFFKEVKLSLIEPLDLPQQVKAHQILTIAALSLCASSEED
ncbi:DUF3822 family protein [Mucilaginibacter glaciei]|uniref:DUF3822 family protein n=1 Tax=Mucilaginibacter glaciei TaxID=2772109 RepID=A0A926NHU5_9SPHI|nr:DUF3822 family protein [Mucilaginibacter glaciei]MBD1392354.1 DUF3822 family protein [Mucilaginibacter glaciei]